MAKVLIVEDEDSLRETLCRYLVHEGHQVIAAASGPEALEAAFDASPDVLIADWMLKNHIHGLHVSEVFRGLHPQLNTILITGFPSRDLVEESDRRGVSRLLEKPFDLAELHRAVDFALTDPTQGEALGPPIAAMAISASGALEFATDRASELLAEAGLEPHPVDFEQVVSKPYQDLLTRAEFDWVEAAPGHSRTRCPASCRTQRSEVPGAGALRTKPPRVTESHMYQAGYSSESSSTK